ncbi:Type IV pilus biogenesis and competence protein PilQ precursor [Rubripirellula obstinata]|uniref:Type IV pilus biogenesis and competence protein PilQ n=1 Tax=Rubripirellula obstinata TaxID=406547 RepID=A0A5B1CLT9_9BACT|nr:hypothetical protein [Rubripirellula obstinata]KAA1262048.1 Type IV pilus biogenesis and competence protein PilQ precursor [Rubripirellula obstinata]
MKTELIEQHDLATGSSNRPGHQQFTDHQHLFAVVWIAIAWIVGSLVFEVTADGAEPDLVNSTIVVPSMMDQWQQQETEFAIAYAGIEEFDRIQRESELRPAFQAVIATAKKETVSKRRTVATRQEIAKKISQHNPVTTDSVATDSVTKNPVTVIPATIAKPNDQNQIVDAGVPAAESAEIEYDELPQLVQQVVHSFQEWMSPVHVDVPSNNTSATRPIKTKENAVAAFKATPKVQSNDQLETVTVADAHIIRAAAKPVIVPQQDEPTDSPTINAPVIATNIRTTVASVEETTPAASTEEKQPNGNSPVEHVAAKWPIDAGELLAGNLMGTAKPENNGVSLNVDKADVRGVIEMLARGYGMNILVAPEVKGTVTANVEGLSPEQTLDGIVKMCNLNLQREGTLIYVYPDTKLPSDARELRVFELDFARAEILEPTVQGLLSPVGSAFITKVDANDNLRSQETIVVLDIPTAILQVQKYIFQADRAPRQVMIEANILEVTLDDNLRHGVDFGSILGGDFSIGAGDISTPPVINETNPLFFARVSGSKIDALIDFLETTNDSKTLASPRVQVINGQNARIQVGEQTGYTVATATQAAVVESVEFLDTGVVLEVTPTISRDNRILLFVKPEVSDPDFSGETGSVPGKSTREVETSVLLDNHQGLVIGGLIREEDTTLIQKLPWLGDIKYAGKLFQRRRVTRERTEIIVALTCHIAEDCIVDERSEIELQRTSEPLYHGALQRNCRPWEARLPDSVGTAPHLDVNKINRRLP